MGSLGNVLGTLYRAYVYKAIVSDVTRFFRRTFGDMDFDKESLLNRVGLTTYAPVKSTIGGLSLFLLGAAAGSLVGLALAPKPGAELRADVKEKALDLLGRAEEPRPIEKRAQA